MRRNSRTAKRIGGIYAPDSEAPCPNAPLHRKDAEANRFAMRKKIAYFALESIVCRELRHMRGGKMAKKDIGISQVHEFMVVGPDDKGISAELAETALRSVPGLPAAVPVDVREHPDADDP